METPLIQGTLSPLPHPRTRGPLWRTSPPPAGAENQGQCTWMGGGVLTELHHLSLSPWHCTTHTHTHRHTHEARRLLFVKEREISIIWGLGIKEISFRYSWIQGLKNVSLRSCLSHYFSQLCFPPLGFFLKQIILKHWQVCHPVNILSI